MGASRALVVSSGMTALDVILRLVKSGQEIVAGDDLYGGTNRLLAFLTEQNGIKVHHVDTTSTHQIIPCLGKDTGAVLLETPTNPLIKVCDIRAIVSHVRHLAPQALIIVDNTMSSPYLQKTLDLGADIEYHSGTKYLSGHHDLMAGVIGVSKGRPDLGDALYRVINATGTGLSPFDGWLLLRGVKTLAIRMDRQQSNAQVIAQRLEGLGFRVHYPGLLSHPQHALHTSQASGPGAVLSFETDDVDQSERIVQGVELWGISVSFGCVNSLISLPCRMSHASIPQEIREARALPEHLVRLCVGIEDVEDLWEDLYHSILKAKSLHSPHPLNCRKEEGLGVEGMGRGRG